VGVESLVPHQQLAKNFPSSLISLCSEMNGLLIIPLAVAVHCVGNVIMKRINKP
jgi:hypothetical protein